MAGDKSSRKIQKMPLSEKKQKERKKRRKRGQERS